MTTTVGLIGSGRIGGTVAKLAVAAGHPVILSAPYGPFDDEKGTPAGAEVVREALAAATR